MRRITARLLPLFVLSLAASLSSCGDESPTTEDTTPEPDPLDFSFETGPWEVAEGDVFECFYTDVITDRELAVRGAQAYEQNEGQHHITVYYTMTPQEVGHHPCEDQEMLEWRQVAGAGAGESDSEYALPEGMAMKVPEGAQMVFQVHYINATGAPYERNDGVTIDVVDPAAVKEYANIFVTLDATFAVDPHGPGTSVTECEVEDDLQVVLMLGHMHEWGTSYKLEQLAADGSVEKVLYEASPWFPEYSSHPPVKHFPMDDPFIIPAGVKLRQTCAWENTEEAALSFPREMCLSFMNYFPDDGEKITGCVPVTPE